MIKTKYLILGAGPAGITVANKLHERKIDFLLLEKEDEAGGLCRSATVDGAPFDIGGGHFLDVRSHRVTEYLFRFMPEKEWNKFKRISKIKLGEDMVDHPIEANIWQMNVERQIQYLKAIAVAGCNTGEPMPENFIHWIYWKLGKEIAEEYMLPYNRKMFGDDLETLGTYWLEKLPSVSFEDTLRSCLTKRSYGKEPGHTSFFYPKRSGYGELWLRMADVVKSFVNYNQNVKMIDFENRIVETYSGKSYQGEKIITTIPWHEFKEIRGMPDELRNEINELKYSSIETRYFNEDMDTKAHWIYDPDPALFYHRKLIRKNFCFDEKGACANGYWTETRLQRTDMISEELKNSIHFVNKYAYPLNTKHKPQIMAGLLKWARERGVYGLGRWGEHQHYNSDVAVEKAIELSVEL